MGIIRANCSGDSFLICHLYAFEGILEGRGHGRMSGILPDSSEILLRRIDWEKS